MTDDKRTLNAAEIKRLGVSNMTAVLLGQRLSTTSPTGRFTNYDVRRAMFRFEAKVFMVERNLRLDTEALLRSWQVSRLRRE